LLAPTKWTGAAIVPVLLAAFVILFGFPGRTKALWAWTIRPSVTPMIMGAGYLAGAYFFVRVATATRWHRVGAGFLGTVAFTTLLLLATLLHWDKFNHGHVSFWAWLALYVATPALLPWLWVNNSRTDPGVPEPGDVTVPRSVRLVAGAGGSLQLGFALFMFARPRQVIPHWPWMLTPLTARTLAAFIAFPAVTWVCFLFDDRWSSFRIPVETASIGLALVAVALLRGAPDFTGSGTTVAAYIVTLVVALGLLVALQLSMRRRSGREAAAT